MDNKAIAGLLYETADLLEIDGQDPFRIRSYRNAAQAIENLSQQVSELVSEPKKLLQVPGIGKGMLTNLQEISKEGRLTLHGELLSKYKPSMRSEERRVGKECRSPGAAYHWTGDARRTGGELSTVIRWCSADAARLA